MRLDRLAEPRFSPAHEKVALALKRISWRVGKTGSVFPAAPEGSTSPASEKFSVYKTELR